MNEPEAREESEKMSDRIAVMVRENGDEVAYDEPPCILWKAEHENCRGCPYKLGCDKLLSLMMLLVIPTTYKPNSFADHLSMLKYMDEQKGKILAAKTLDELRLLG